MRHLIFGTAGHIDHGKTSLVRALTGFDCDTHAVEKRRGITINLGFAHCDLPSGRISFIDTPGHKDFIATMVAGAGGIDRALLVIAADEGVMPQTREHLRILTLLGVDSGIIVLTRTDLVDEDVLAAAREEAYDAVRDSCLARSPMIAVSSRDGRGIDALLEALDEVLRTSTSRMAGPVFRMYIDRCFTAAGHGAVVAGTVLGGGVVRGQNIVLLPGEKEYRIRGMERHGVAVDQVAAGDRASLNLVGLHQEEFQQGMLVSDRPLPSTHLLDTRIEYTADSGSLGVRSQAMMLLATQRTEVSIHLLDIDKLSSGGFALAQLHSRMPCIAFHGDRFILRNSSGDATLGGGVIIDAHPLHHRRRRASLLHDLRLISDGSLPELVAHEARKSPAPVSCSHTASILGQHPDAIAHAVRSGLPADVVAIETADELYLLRTVALSAIQDGILRLLGLSHKRNPLDDGGRSSEELLCIFGAHRTPAHEAVLRSILEANERRGLLKRVRNTWAAANHDVCLSDEDLSDIEVIERFHLRDDMSVPLMSELRMLAQRTGITERRLHHLLFFLTRRGVLVHIGEEYLHRSAVDLCRYILLDCLERVRDGATVACFRDIVHGNRRICLLLLAQFDAEGIIERRENSRFITELGRETLLRLRTERKKASTPSGDARESRPAHTLHVEAKAR